MMDRLPKTAQLSEEELAKVQALEAELGDDVVVVAYEKPWQPARLTEEQVDKLMNLEQELRKAYLVAYRKPKEA